MPEKPTYEELERRVLELERTLAGQTASRNLADGKNGGKPPEENAEKYRLMVENANEAILAAQDGVFVFSNPRGETLFGYSEKELGSRPLAEFVHEADRRMVSERHEARLAGDASIPEIYDFRIIHKSGDIRWVALKVTLFSWENRPATLCFMTDITERKLAEEKLRESESRYRAIFDQAAVGITVVSPDGRILETNETMCAMLGYTPEELTGLTVPDINWPEDMERQRPLIQDVLDGKRDKFQLEKRYLRKDGQPVWVYHSSNVVRKDNGVIEYAIGASTDITERRQAEDKLRKSEERLRTVLESMGDEVYVHDATGRFILVNEAACRGTGYGRDELLRLDVDDVVLQRRFFKTQGQWLDFDRNSPFCFETRHKRRDGSVYPVEITLTRIAMDNGQAFLAMARDITDRKRAEVALQKSLTEKEVLLREIHHRVKNNMQAIISLLRMHARRIDDARLSEIFTDCRDRIEAMSLIHEALYQSENLAEIDFKTYIRKLCRNLAQAHDAPRRSIDLTANVSDGSMDMDRGIAVGMVIAELISNAFKHAFPHGARGTVSVHLDRPDGETVRLVVSDTGKGLPADFDIQKPSSLGMRLVAGAVTRELGGDIAAVNDGGAKFVIRFNCGEEKKKLIAGENDA